MKFAQVPRSLDGHTPVITIVRRFSDLPIAREIWNDLASRSETNTVFQTYEWMQSWCETFNVDVQPWIVLIYRQERLIGIAPLILDTSSGRRVLRILGDTHADYCDVLTGLHKETVLSALLDLLAQRRSEWDCLSLINIPEHSSTIAMLRSLAPAAGLHAILRGKVACPAIELQGTVDLNASVVSRKSLKRPHNYFRRQGKLTVQHLSDVAAVSKLLPSFFQQHVERWSSTRTPSLFARGSNREFYHRLLHALLPTGWLQFTAVWLDDRPIAFHFGFLYADRYIWYKPSFDIAYRKHSPGALLLRYLLQHAIRERCTEFDFTVGNELFKHRYANVVRFNRNLLLLPNRTSYLLARCNAACRQLLKRLRIGVTVVVRRKRTDIVSCCPAEPCRTAEHRHA